MVTFHFSTTIFIFSNYSFYRPNPTIDELEVAIHEFCSLEWNDVQGTLIKRHKYTHDAQLPNRCLEALYIALLLEEGFGFHGTNRNITIALKVSLFIS